AEYLRTKDKATLLTTVLALFAAALVVAGAFLEAAGPDQLTRILRHRTGFDPPGSDEYIPFRLLSHFFFGRVHQNVAPVLFFFSVVDVCILVWQRRFLLPSVYFAYIGYCIMLRNFVGMHYFTFLPFDFFIIVALLSFVWRLAATLSRLTGKAMPATWGGAG